MACVFWKILDKIENQYLSLGILQSWVYFCFICIIDYSVSNETFAGVWSGEGCSVTNEGANLTNSTTCSCDHLTNFAVLMQLDTNAVPIPKADEKALTILSILGGSLSILCLTLMLVIYALFGMYKTERGMVHTNLCVALLISQLVFLTGIDAVSDTTGCRVAAVLLHYFLLASFSWMLVEGALLVVSAKFVFHRRLRPWKLMLPGWGVPAVVVAITFAVAAEDYGSKEKCWLIGQTTWAFIAPVIFVVAVNLIFLIFVLESLVKLKIVKSRTEFDKIRVVVRALLIVLPLMGYTWLFGLGVNAADGVNLIFYYLFVILNSSQGVLVFFLYCLNTEEVKQAFGRFRRRFKRRVNPQMSFDLMMSTSSNGVEKDTEKDADKDARKNCATIE
ncbi:latrophilin-like protein LAT-2 [Patiria miniata]|uniref:Adhesion G-protein coupled receptor D1-like n=1 Tax=Patiria miniata TaxID=46514 RepID=A0A913ZKM9_PATMI|nr:latrophilin-like protein LAT-2 [Patiria miniata]